MPDNITVDKVLKHDIYAKGNVNAYDGTFTNIKKTFTNGQRIGNVWSWIIRDGEVWYMMYLTPSDYNNFIGTYIKHDAAKIALPDLPGILEEIQKEKEQEDINKNGMLAHLAKKYAPWIVGGVVVAIAAPTLLNAGRKNINGMTSDQQNLAGIAVTAVAVYLLTRKKRKAGDLIIGDPYGGQFLDDEGNDITQGTNSTGNNKLEVVSVPAGSGNVNKLIEYIGPFEVAYKQPSNGIIAGMH